jgi:hypothetical protein
LKVPARYASGSRSMVFVSRQSESLHVPIVAKTYVLPLCETGSKPESKCARITVVASINRLHSASTDQQARNDLLVENRDEWYQLQSLPQAEITDRRSLTPIMPLLSTSASGL